MILYIDPARPKWVRRVAIALTCAGLAASLFALLDGSVPPAPDGARPPAAHVQALGETRAIARPAVSGAVAAAPMRDEGLLRVAQAAPAVGPRSAPQQAQPFRFLGRVTADGETSVILYGGGRTLTVRATGPIDDDHTVDAIEEDHLVIRQVHQGVSQVLELASRPPTSVAPISAAETPAD